GDRGCRPSAADPGQYAQRAHGGVAGVLGSAAARSVARGHADHGTNELPPQRRTPRPAEDHIRIRRRLGEDERLAYRIAVAKMLKRCTPVPVTEGLGNALAGRPLTIRFVDNRKLRQAENAP